MADFLRALAGASLSGGVFILAAVLIRSGVRNRLPKHFLVLLWMAVLAHFLFASALPSPTSIYNYVVFKTPQTVSEATAVTRSPTRGVATPDAVPSVPRYDGIVGDGAAADWSWALFVVWMAGAVGLAALFVRSYWSTRRRFDCAILLRGKPAVDRWAARKKNPPRVFVSDRTTTPLAVGLFRRRIILPAGLDLDNAATVEGILEHEYIHGRHHHNAMKAMVCLATVAHWFNPLVWLFWFLFNHDIELACDESVIQSIGPGRRAEYAHSLVTVAEKALVPFPLVSAFSARTLRERIADVMGYRRTTIPVIAAEALLLVAMFALFGTSALSAPVPALPAMAIQANAVQVTPAETGRTAPEPPKGSANSSLATALEFAGGGTVIKREFDDGGSVHEYEILAGDFEHEIKIGVPGGEVLKYSRKRAKKHFAGVDVTKFIGVERASRIAAEAIGGGEAAECALTYVKPGRFVYIVEFESGERERKVRVDAVDGGVDMR